MKTRYIAALAVLAMVFVGFSALATEDSDAALGGKLMGYAEGNEDNLPMQVFYYDDTKDYLKFDFGTVKPSSDFRVTLIDQTGEEGVKVINLVQTGAKAYAYITLTAASTYTLTVDPIDGSADRTATLTIQQMVKVTYHDPVKEKEDVIQYLATGANLDQTVFTDNNATFAGYVDTAYDVLSAQPTLVTAVPEAASIQNNAYDVYALWTVDIVFNKTGASETTDMENQTAYLNANYQKLTKSTYESDDANFAGWVKALAATLTKDDIIADEATITPDFFDGMTVTNKEVQLCAVYKIDVTYDKGTIEGVTITGSTAAGVAYLYFADAVAPETEGAWKIFTGQTAAENGFVAPGYTFVAWQYADEQTTVAAGGALVEEAVISNMAQKALVLTATWEVAGYDVFISNIHVSTGASDASTVTVKVRDLSGSALVEGTTAVVAGSYYAVDTDGDETVFIFGNIEDLNLAAAPAIDDEDESVHEFEVSLGTEIKPYWVYGQYVSDDTATATVLAESYGVLLNENDTDYTVVTLTISNGTGQEALEGITGAGNYFLGTEVTPAYTGTKTVKFYEDSECTTEITGAVTLDGDKTIYYKESA